ncbi:MAG: hypothetical protein M3Y54_09200 [Bacteroidota bacterium]|nr:hypothetical protein [Bacteroidota bacterium]
MENFETELSKLLFKKANPNPEVLLKQLLWHVYETVLIPAHRILLLQKEYILSTLSFVDSSGYGDLGDGFEDRPVAMLTVYRGDEKEPVFAYELGFEGEINSNPATLWSNVEAPNYISPSEATNGTADSEEALFDFKRFNTLDRDEVVALVQQDLLNALGQFL